VTSLVEFSNFVLIEMEDGLQVDAVYTDFSNAFDKVNHGLLLSDDFLDLFLFDRSYTSRSGGDYLSETIYCHSGVSQSSHVGPLFFIADINDMLDIFENVRVFAYADDLKLYMRVSSTDDCRVF
jgi:Reverse transcriptase (RNA-dependent DNA polymerase)